MSPQGGETFSCLLNQRLQLVLRAHSVLRGTHRPERGQRDRVPLLRKLEGCPSNMPPSLPTGISPTPNTQDNPTVRHTERSTWSRQFLNCCSLLRGFLVVAN